MSERFPEAWLRLREPHDHRARSEALVRELDRSLRQGAVDLLDLGCGLGSNLRFTAPRLDRAQRWILADHDAELLARLPEHLMRWAHGLGWPVREVGGAVHLGPRIVAETALVDLGSDPWPEADAIVAQALLDVWREPQLERLVAEFGRRPLLAALTVDGRVLLHPSDEDDELVLAAFRADQVAGKPGHRAGAWLAGRLSRSHRVVLDEADWRISGDPAMIREMLDGLAEAAARRADPARIDRWLERRRARLPERLVVGHVDLLAVGG